MRCSIRPKETSVKWRVAQFRLPTCERPLPPRAPPRAGGCALAPPGPPPRRQFRRFISIFFRVRLTTRLRHISFGRTSVTGGSFVARAGSLKWMSAGRSGVLFIFIFICGFQVFCLYFFNSKNVGFVFDFFYFMSKIIYFLNKKWRIVNTQSFFFQIKSFLFTFYLEINIITISGYWYYIHLVTISLSA